MRAGFCVYYLEANLIFLHQIMKSTKVQTLGSNTWRRAKELLHVREALRERTR